MSIKSWHVLFQMVAAFMPFGGRTLIFVDILMENGFKRLLEVLSNKLETFISIISQSLDIVHCSMTSGGELV